MAASAGTVTLDLDANAVKMIRELQKAERQTKRSATQMRRDMERAAKRMAVALTGVAVGLTAVVRSSLRFADNIGKTADKLGVGVEALQELRFAARRAGIEQNTLDMALQRFTRRAAEAAQGTGEAEKTLKALGIQLTDTNGQMRSTEALLGDVADAFTAGIDPATRLAYAQKLFDSEGVVMVNLLRDGSAGLRNMREEARALGVVMSEDLVRNAEEANDKLEDFTQLIQVRIAQAVTENAGAIMTLVDSLISFVEVIAKATKGWNDWLAAQGVGVNTIDEIRIRGEQLLRERQKLQAKLDDVESGSEVRRNRWNESAEELRAEIEAKTVEMLALQTQAKALQSAETEKVEAKAETKATMMPVPKPEEVDKDAQKIASIIKDLADQIKTFGGDQYDAALLKLIDADATEEQITQARHLIDELRMLDADEERRTAAAEERNELEQEYQSLVQSTQTDVERHAALINRINELYQAGIIPSAEEYGEIVKRVNADFLESTKQQTDFLEEFTKQAARNMQDALSDFLFDPFEDGVKGMLRSFSEMLRRMAAEAVAAQIAKKIFGDTSAGGGSSSGGWLASIASIFATGGGGGGGGGTWANAAELVALAKGGPVAANQPYIVGEQGPELFMPKLAGQVVPNDQLGTLKEQLERNTEVEKTFATEINTTNQFTKLKEQLQATTDRVVLGGFKQLLQKEREQITTNMVPFGGFRALGGPVLAGVPYMVGERGPELFVPQASGEIVANKDLRQSNTNVTNVYLPPQARPRTAEQTAYEIANRQRRATARNR